MIRIAQLVWADIKLFSLCLSSVGYKHNVWYWHVVPLLLLPPPFSYARQVTILLNPISLSLKSVSTTEQTHTVITYQLDYCRVKSYHQGWVLNSKRNQFGGFPLFLSCLPPSFFSLSPLHLTTSCIHIAVQ